MLFSGLPSGLVYFELLLLLLMRTSSEEDRTPWDSATCIACSSAPTHNNKIEGSNATHTAQTQLLQTVGSIGVRQRRSCRFGYLLPHTWREEQKHRQGTNHAQPSQYTTVPLPA